LAEIRLKTVKRAQIAEIFPNRPNFTQIGTEKTNHGLNLGQLGRYSTKIGGGNSTAENV
jgi:hypothetical protein